MTVTVAVNAEQRKSVFDAQAIRILVLATWFGLLTGLAEALFRVVWQQLIRHHLIWVSRDVLWMAPVSDLIIFLLGGSCLALLAWPLRRVITLRVVTFVLALLSFMALLQLLPQLHPYAVILLASGLAFQTSRMVVARQDSFYRLVKHTSVWLIVLVVTIAVVSIAARQVSERRAVAHLPAAANGAPNVLLIVLDTVPARSLSLYGYQRRTSPQLEQIARNGVVFDNAIATAPWTLPSHASIFTGHLPNELNVSWTKPLDKTYPTLAEKLRDHGYETAGFVGNLVYCSYTHGLNRGMVRYRDFPVTLGQTFISSTLGKSISEMRWFERITGYQDDLNRKDAETINREFLGWLSARDNERPFFGFLNYYDAHASYLPPSPFDTRFGPNRPNGASFFSRDELTTKRWQLPVQAQEVERNLYDGSIAYLDSQLGLLFASMDKLGVLKNTLIIVTADHGEQFGEHGLYDHGNSLYLPLLHVPLLIVFPSHVPAGERIQQAVSLRDLPATVVDLAGLDQSTNFPGKTMARYWNKSVNDGQAAEEAVYSEVKPGFHLEKWYPTAQGRGYMKSVIRGNYHFIVDGDGKEELFDWTSDPDEKTNLAESEGSRPVLEEFRLALNTTFHSK